MSDVDRDELRRLLDEATPGPWMAEGSQVLGPDGVLVAAVREHSTLVDRPDALIIAAAVNALPGLLDALDKAEGHRDSLAATLIEVQREKLAPEWAIERVREMHTLAHERCNFPESAFCECADAHCEECGASYPCPTIQALDGK